MNPTPTKSDVPKIKPEEPKAKPKPPDPKLTAEQIKAVMPLLKARIPVDEGPGCFVCKWIHEDLEKNGKLTDYPQGNMGGEFPVTGKYSHLQVEGMIS